MSIRGLVIVLFLLAALGLGWQQRQRLQSWGQSVPLPTVQSPIPSPVVADTGAPRSSSRFKRGELRKCVNGQQVSYSNVECPPGAKEEAVGGGAVTVLPATPVSKPDTAGSGPSALHKALDMTRDDTLKDKIIERAVEGATR